MNRLVLFSTAVVILALVASSFLLRDLVMGGNEVKAELAGVNSGLGDAARSVRRAATEQTRQFDAVNRTLEAAKTEQVQLASRIDSSMDELREERDAVTAEVRGVLEEKTGEYARKELELHDRAALIRQEAVRARQARREIIGDAIKKLAALEGAEPVDVPAVPALSMQADIGLKAYKLKTGPVEIVGVADDASGVTYDPDTGSGIPSIVCRWIDDEMSMPSMPSSCRIMSASSAFESQSPRLSAATRAGGSTPKGSFFGTS